MTQEKLAAKKRVVEVAEKLFFVTAFIALPTAIVFAIWTGDSRPAWSVGVVAFFILVSGFLAIDSRDKAEKELAKAAEPPVSP